MNRLNLFAVLFLAFVGCGQPSYRLADSEMVDKMAASHTNGTWDSEIELMEPDANAEHPVHERKVIKEGHISFESNDLVDTRQYIDSILRSTNGYVSSEREFTNPSRISQSLSIRIPFGRFDEFVDKLSQGIGTFDDKSITTRDVTAEYIDVSARIRTKKELEQRYLELLKRANSVTEILEIESELGNIRGDIESMEGRLRYLADQTDYSTLEIMYYKTISEKTAFGNKFSQGFVNGWNNLIWFLVGLVNIWPFVILIPVASVLTLRWLRLRRKRRRADNA